ncbi:YadA-like family protein [Salmonella enterica]|nr:YadA-like family protein [Salmonella enterica]ELI3391276.1 YadA-like family protein [Salmonella enterica subsp. enterica serovar Infantis]
MNRIFKVLWNAATGTFVVTSETAKSRGKKSGRRKLAVSALIGLSSIMVSADALANAGNDTGDGVTPTGTQTGGKGWIAIGTDATANTYTNVDGASAAMGYKASAMGKWSTAIGSYSQSTGDSSLALGVKSVSAGDRAIAMGASSSASGSYSMAMGVYANSSGAKSVALGYRSVASGATSSALGYQATASGDDSAAFGNGAKAVGTNSVALGSGSIAQEDNSVAVGNSTTQRQITYVAKGDINSTSTDAVTGAQIYSLSQSVADRLGGGASVNSDGTVNAPLYEVGTGIYNNVGSALSALNTSITNTEASVAGLAEDALLWDESISAFSASHTGNASKITNLAAGTLAADSTDAVNGSQLFDTNEKVDQNTADIATNTDSINQNTADITANTDSINQNTTDIAANTTNITQNSTAIENLNTSVSDINTSITGLTDNALLWDEDIGAFSANHGGSTSKITNVAAGALSEDSTDAVNGSQLYETNQKVDQNTSAIADINTSITNLGTDALSWDDEEGAFSASHGTSGTNKITNVAAGEIASDSTDAVNGSQLYETNMLISQYNESISQLAGDTSETYITENGTGVKYIRTNDNGLEGQDAYATGNGATAVGYDAVASGAGSLALGQNSSSSIDGSIALGSGSTSNRAITTGIRETSVTSDGVVIGYNTTDRELLGALSLGTDGESYRQITNVADGSEAQDAVTVRQLQNAIGAVTTTPTKYYHANSTEEDSLAVGTDSLAMGAKTIVNADAGIGIGLNTLVMADAINGIAIGSNARANHANSIAMGNGSQTTRGAQTDYTAYNMDTPQNSVGEFSVGSEDGQRQITNVAAGSADTDAVNVSQLKVTDAQVSRNTQSITNLNTQVSNLDTRVTNIENGIGDIVTTGSTKYFKTNTDGVDANAQGADSVAIGSGSIAAAENSVALGTNSVADEANTVSVGSSTQQRRITNVAAGVNNTDAVNVAQLKASEAGSVRYETNADGSVNYSVLNLGDGSGGTTRIGNVSAAVNDTDAVNYAQLKRSVEEANTYTDQKMGEMNSKIKGVENKMSGGIASAMAMAGLPQAYAPGANMTSIAGGTFNGESAVAIGVSMVSESGGWVYKLQGTSNSQGDYSAAIGAGFQW